MSQEDFQQHMNNILNTYYMADAATKKAMKKAVPKKPTKYLGNGNINPEYQQWEKDHG